MFFALWKPKTMVFTMFFVSGSKIQGICSVFVPVPSKNTGIYAVFSMLLEELFSCQRYKNIVNYSMLKYFFSRLQDIVSICQKDKNIVNTNVSAQQKPPKPSAKQL